MMEVTCFDLVLLTPLKMETLKCHQIDAEIPRLSCSTTPNQMIVLCMNSKEGGIDNVSFS